MTVIIVTGGRSYSNRVFVYAVLDRVCKALINRGQDPLAVVEGGAKGADALAKQYASDRRIQHVQVTADWRTFERRAGPIRNANMLKLFEHDCVLVAFPGGTGTENCVNQAKRKNIPVIDMRNGPKDD